ncbi:hypothetical protein NIES4071_107490 (plasmid) [Calothrix sp. NIES-4071]|nr:hypothetical protein NIES4071_107490 [Calothrix sp. NIES-4071]BAZ64789.1 hypothetical protein NIES4105_105220 [Calothrix sp. NIES-4105]
MLNNIFSSSLRVLGIICCGVIALTTPQINEGNNEQPIKGKELMKATVSELHSEKIQEALQESLKPEIKLNGCIKVTPCPTGNPQGC